MRRPYRKLNLDERRILATMFQAKATKTKIAETLGHQAWFCDPQAPWQKGSVENMNKRVRRYLPRDTALLSLPNRYMRSICERLNATPRKCLGYRTPAEAFRDELMKLEQR